MNAIKKNLDSVIRNSAFIARIGAIRGDARSYRPLTDGEISMLESRGNRSLHWDLGAFTPNSRRTACSTPPFPANADTGRCDATEITVSGAVAPGRNYNSLIVSSATPLSRRVWLRIIT